MVGGKEKQIFPFQKRKKASQPPVQFGKGPGVALDIVAVAVFHIEIHQVHKAEALKFLPGNGRSEWPG